VTAAITDDDARYAFGIVERICAQVGPGVPGSHQERQRAAILEQELQAHLGPGNVAVEEFTVAPGAFTGSLRIGAVLTLAAALSNVAIGRLPGVSPWLTAIVGLACSAAAVLLVVLEFLLTYEIVDPLFRKERSVNVIGTLRAPTATKPKRLLILSGHHDSAPENIWFRLLGYGGLAASATMFLGLVTMLALCALQLTGLLVGDAEVARIGTAGGLLLAYPIGPAIVVGAFFTRGRKNGGTVPGAVDNLAASALVVSLCRFLAKNPTYLPADTEIRFISFGSEEAGVRGSRSYVQRHLDELRRLDARLLNVEMVAHPVITILTSDLNHTVKSSAEMVRSAVAAAESAGVPFVVKPSGAGVATDAGPFSRAGLKATTLMPFKMPQQLAAFYHQKWDRPEILTIGPLRNVLELGLVWIRAGGGEAERGGRGDRAGS